METVIASAVIALLLAGIWLFQFLTDHYVWFWLEVQRQPDLAFVLIARDPAFHLSAGDPDSLLEKPGWFGPITIRFRAWRFGFYVDECQVEEPMERVRLALVDARRVARRGCAA